MSEKILKSDAEILLKLFEYKVLAVKQLSFLCRRSTQVIRRRLRSLESQQLVSMLVKNYGRGMGRPENIVIPAGKGVDLLIQNGLLSAQAAACHTDRPHGAALIEHGLLLHWFIIHLLALERKDARFATKHFIEKPSIDEKTGDGFRIIPDAVFTITNKELDKTLLFFLEVDMGTETIASTNRNHKDLRQKIINYQNLFRNDGYRYYEDVFNSKLNGFRLLLLAYTKSRMKSLCDFVRSMQPSNFIWIMDQDHMFRKGLFADTWVKGGLLGNSFESILGNRLSFEESVIDKIK